MQTRCCSPPRELAGEMVGAGAEADAVERGAGVGGVGHGVEVLREHDVFERGEIGDQVELLEDEADLVGAEAVELGGGHGVDFFAVDGELAGGGRVEAAEQVDERRFAGAGGAGDGDPFARADGEAGVVEGADGAGCEAYSRLTPTSWMTGVSCSSIASACWRCASQAIFILDFILPSAGRRAGGRARTRAGKSAAAVAMARFRSRTSGQQRESGAEWPCRSSIGRCPRPATMPRM